jgi:hypothetical protein
MDDKVQEESNALKIIESSMIKRRRTSTSVIQLEPSPPRRRNIASLNLCQVPNSKRRTIDETESENENPNNSRKRSSGSEVEEAADLKRLRLEVERMKERHALIKAKNDDFKLRQIEQNKKLRAQLKETEKQLSEASKTQMLSGTKRSISSTSAESSLADSGRSVTREPIIRETNEARLALAKAQAQIEADKVRLETAKLKLVHEEDIGTERLRAVEVLVELAKAQGKSDTDQVRIQAADVIMKISTTK